MSVTVEGVWEELLRHVAADNNVTIERCKPDLSRVENELKELIDAGFFQDSSLDITGSYWIMAAAETEERVLYFQKNAEAAAAVSDALEEIFERECMRPRADR